MFITIIWTIFFVLFMLLCMVALLSYFVVQLFLSYPQKRRLIYNWVRFWGRVTILSTGSKVIIEGLENVPPERNLCLVGNHQSNFDIPALLGWIGIPAGFVAKQELKKVPILYQWMKQLPCVFINRKNAREAMKSFKESSAVIAAGNPIVLFPEGTRAKGDKMASFKAGSLKLPQMAHATILPFAIKGAWRILEIDGKIHSTTIKIRLLPPIHPSDELYKDKDALFTHLEQSISQNLEEL